MTVTTFARGPKGKLRSSSPLVASRVRLRHRTVMLLQPARRHGRRFLNPVPTTVADPRTMYKILPKFLFGGKARRPAPRLGPFFTDARIFDTAPASGLRVTWMGHSTMLIEIDGARLLVDPVWDERASPNRWVGPKRFFAPPLALERLPRLDAVLVSHDHFDHLGARTVRALVRLQPEAQWIAPLGVGRVLAEMGVQRCREMDWLEEIQLAEIRRDEIQPDEMQTDKMRPDEMRPDEMRPDEMRPDEMRPDEMQSDETQRAEANPSAKQRVAKQQAETRSGGLRITALPARHFSGRGLWNRFQTLWASFVLAGPRHRVYYGADSGEWAGFAEIGARFGPFDLTMLEIGASDPLWEEIHMGPQGAVRSFRALGGAGLLMPIHWGLFDLALHPWRQPIESLWRLPELPLWTPQPGEPTEVVRGAEVRSEWWRKSDGCGSA